MFQVEDTICAVATPPGEGGIGIVRVSGPRAFQIAESIFRNNNPSNTWKSHTIIYGDIIDPKSHELVDDAIVLVFRGPSSYTGEDVIEFSCHGGSVTVGKTLSLAILHGARLALPGEFTQRAFLNGRLDLVQAEAVRDQIKARTEASHRIAMQQRGGRLSRELYSLRDSIVGIIAAIEVTIDFSDEVGDLDYDEIVSRLTALKEKLQQLIDTSDRGRIFREGIRLTIVGRPNVGKSSLLNAILGEDRAIVSPVAGTTRDIIEETANIKGIPVTAIDTAGIRTTDDFVEKIGVERARKALDISDISLFVINGEEGWTNDDGALFAEIDSARTIILINKSDLLDQFRIDALHEEIGIYTDNYNPVSISALTGDGMDLLQQLIADSILGSGKGEADSVVISNVRHKAALEQARDSIDLALGTTLERLPGDFITIDLRAALNAVGLVTGETASEEIIHRIFHDFCVGK